MFQLNTLDYIIFNEIFYFFFVLQQYNYSPLVQVPAYIEWKILMTCTCTANLYLKKNTCISFYYLSFLFSATIIIIIFLVSYISIGAVKYPHPSQSLFFAFPTHTYLPIIPLLLRFSIESCKYNYNNITVRRRTSLILYYNER